MIYILVIGGLALLLAGRDLLVRGVISLSANIGISPLLMGLIIVGFGTSAPELIISIEAALTGAPGVALGNVVCSNIANVLLVLGADAQRAGIQPQRRRRSARIPAPHGRVDHQEAARPQASQRIGEGRSTRYRVLS